MRRRPLFWGMVWFLLCGAGWFVSVIMSVITVGAFREMANLFGIAAVASVPVTIVLEIIWIKQRKG